MVALATDDRPTVIEKAFEKMPKLVGYLGEKEFLTGKKVCMVDFIFWETIDTLLALTEDRRVFTEYPSLEVFYERMKKLPNFANYLASDECLKAPYFAPACKIKI